MKTILQKILAILARRTLKKHKPMIIGITGSVGKTTTREAILAVLKKSYRVAGPEKNYNNEIGLPLTILQAPNCGKNIFKWLRVLRRGWTGQFAAGQNYPEILVLEYGVDRQGDMDYLLKIAKPYIAVATAIGDVPMHMEYFEDPEELIKEKSKLVAALPVEGHAILNHDDYAVYDMREKTKAHIATYGMAEKADFRVINYELYRGKDEELGDTPDGISFKIEYKGSVVPVRIATALGEPHAIAAAAAMAIGTILNMNLVEIAEALHDWTPPAGRMRLISGLKKSFILDDTYNAGPDSMRRALDTLQTLPGKRKIAVLGDMLELGKYTEAAHRATGDQVAKFADLILTVGVRSKFIAEQALIWDTLPGQIMKFDDSESAGKALQPLIKEGDVILVKGSQGMRMERVVEEIMAHPEEAENLLVRQGEEWKGQ